MKDAKVQWWFKGQLSYWRLRNEQLWCAIIAYPLWTWMERSSNWEVGASNSMQRLLFHIINPNWWISSHLSQDLGMNCAFIYYIFANVNSNLATFNPKNKGRCHRHPAFFVSGTMEECLEDCWEVTGTQFYPLPIFDFLIELSKTNWRGTNTAKRRGWDLVSLFHLSKVSINNT